MEQWKRKILHLRRDLTCQAWPWVQQDLALGALIGVTHAERNGHHYVDGFDNTPATETQAFLAAHPDLYVRDGNIIRLSIHDGDLLTGTADGAGLCNGSASGLVGAGPAWTTKSKILQEQKR